MERDSSAELAEADWPPPCNYQQRNTALIDKSDDLSKASAHLMEHLEYVFRDRVFSGPPPTERFLARFELMLGVRPEEFAADKRGRKKTAPNSKGHNAYSSSGQGVTALDSDAWVLHLEGFALEKFWATRKRSKPTSAVDLHPLSYAQALAESEVQLNASATEYKGPLVSLYVLKIHQLCIRSFGELQKELRGAFIWVFGRVLDELIRTQVHWAMITGYIMRSDEISHAGLDQGMLAKAGEIVQKIVGTKELEFLYSPMRIEGRSD
ncbi:hypothetical protein DXG03_000569 [Asterophora parasitica]|uniref:Uncharacterized protein n=1 Tax=Asterophora parasitica TaxID=117018 RepID=A0A9P7G4Z1_9AGAR|nr:hypothetical protein DXG03_000569 [Asterophora parasitica]